MAQLVLHGGFLKGIGGKDITAHDKFYLGGPQTLRGFQTRGVGPHSDGDALGSDVSY